MTSNLFPFVLCGFFLLGTAQASDSDDTTDPPEAVPGTCLVMSLNGSMPEGRTPAIPFDVNDDGSLESLVRPAFGAGLFAMDLDGDGEITTGGELLGCVTGTPFTALAALDTNGDGLLDGNDDTFGTVSVWTSESSSPSSGMILRPLSDLGVEFIYLGCEATQDGDFATAYSGVDGSVGYLASVDATTFVAVPAIAACAHGKPQGDCTITLLPGMTRCTLEGAACTNNQGGAGTCETRALAGGATYCLCTGSKLSPVLDTNWSVVLGALFAMLIGISAFKMPRPA